MNKIIEELDIHIVQSEEWGTFKTRAGTNPTRVGDLQYTRHKIPLINKYIAYAPKVNFYKQKFSWKELKETLKDEKCVALRFDVPNIVEQENPGNEYKKIVESLNEHCRLAPRDTFAKWNVLLNISENEEILIKNLSQKTRYNVKLAAKKGVEVKLENNEKGINIFNKLLKETAKRQCFLAHSDKYYEKAFETLSSYKMANILIAYYENKPLVAWMLFNKDKTLYYAYGGSTTEHRNLMASNLMAWEAIKLGKRLNCTNFDMWGATGDKNHSYWGFTKFKLGYGGTLVKYIDSYDFVINKPIYKFFNLAYGTYWKLRHRGKQD